MGHTVHILYVNKIHRVSKKAKYRHEKKIMCGMNERLSMILKFFFNFGRFEPCDSYKLYSYKKESVYRKIYMFMNYIYKSFL